MSKKSSLIYWLVVAIIVLAEGLGCRTAGINSKFIDSLSTFQYIIYLLCFMALMIINYAIISAVGIFLTENED